MASVHRWFKVPNALVDNLGALGLDGTDFAIFCKIHSHQYNSKKLPFMHLETIATALGLHRSNVCKRIQAMEKRGLLQRVFPKSQRRFGLATEYDTSPLFERLSTMDLPNKRGRKGDAADNIEESSDGQPPPPTRGVLVDGQHFDTMAQADYGNAFSTAARQS